jgi:hypothetical protein
VWAATCRIAMILRKYATLLTLQFQQRVCIFGRRVREGGKEMAMPEREKEWADKARQFIKAELKRRRVSYKDLANRLKAHGLEETEAGIASKLCRGTFAVTFFLATLAVLEMEGVRLEDL